MRELSTRYAKERKADIGFGLYSRIREMCEALLAHEGKASIEQIMGSDIDVLKLQTCMNLFNRIAPNDVFRKVLDAFF